MRRDLGIWDRELFDYEALTLADLRSLSALNDSKQHTEAAREE